MICEVCNEEFEEQFFNLEQNKCILHCEKDYSYEKEEEFEQYFYIYISNQRNKQFIQLKNISFPYHFIFNQNNIFQFTDQITFETCTFYGSLKFASQNMTFIFTKCNFLGIWEHINIKKLAYFNCNFDNYLIFNLPETRKEINDLTFFDCGFKTINLTGACFKKKLFHYTNENKNYNIEILSLVDCLFDEDIIFNSDREKNYADNFSIKSLSFHGSTFKRKVKIQFCEIEEADFYNTKFDDLADFYQTKFKKVNFERTDFKGISVFSETEFKCDVDFKYTKFLGKAIFRDTVIKGKLNLRNSIFDDEANFLDVTSQKRNKNKDNEFVGEIKSIQVANRETARVIKNFYDNSNNIIEANRFYALEMEEREKELQKNKIKNFIEWIVFKAHKISSNHSQDYMLTLLWMTVITLGFAFLENNTYCPNDMLFFSSLMFFAPIIILWILVCIFALMFFIILYFLIYFKLSDFLTVPYIRVIKILLHSIKTNSTLKVTKLIFKNILKKENIKFKFSKDLTLQIGKNTIFNFQESIKIFKTLYSWVYSFFSSFYFKKIFLFSISIIIYKYTEVTLKSFANLINPFSIMTGKDELTFSTLIYKVIIAYLIYQFIISIRQNTRRK